MSQPLSDVQLARIRADVQLAAEGPMIGVPCGAQRFEAWTRIGDQHGAALLAEVDRLRALIAAAPPRPSDGHSAVYIDQHNQSVWSDCPTVPPSDDVLPMVWASEQAQSREDLAERGVELRVVGWIK